MALRVQEQVCSHLAEILLPDTLLCNVSRTSSSFLPPLFLHVHWVFAFSHANCINSVEPSKHPERSERNYSGAQSGVLGE